MAQLETATWQYLHCPVVFLTTHGKDFYFYNIQKEIVKNGA